MPEAGTEARSTAANVVQFYLRIALTASRNGPWCIPGTGAATAGSRCPAALAAPNL